MNKKIIMTARIAFGIMLLGIAFIGLSGSMSSTQYPEAADRFMKALQDTGYVMGIVISLKLLVGISLLFDLFVPLTLVVFMPISVNMILFHAFLDVKGILPALVIVLLNVYLLVGYIESYKPLFKARRKVPDRISGNAR